MAFMDGTTVWVNYSQDIFLLFTLKFSAEFRRGATSSPTMSSKQLTIVQQGDVFYVDICTFSEA